MRSRARGPLRSLRHGERARREVLRRLRHRADEKEAAGDAALVLAEALLLAGDYPAAVEAAQEAIDLPARALRAQYEAQARDSRTTTGDDISPRRGNEETGRAMKKTVAVIPGEDAAPEAVAASVALVDSMELPIRWVYPSVGERAADECGDTFPEAARRAIDEADTTLFGATSGPSARALFYLRWGKRTYANVRPLRWSPGLRSPLADPSGIDLAIVRENLEDLYLFAEGDLADLAPLNLFSFTAGVPVHELGDGRFAIKAITRAGSERVVRHAFELAGRRRAAGRPGRVTLGAKSNMLPQTDGLFRDVGRKLAGEYPDVAFETLIIDDLAHRLTAAPASFDVLVMPNLYGDILSDAAAGMVGGLGLAPSGCYGNEYAYFESAHGTAPDLTGRHVINPTATLLSAAMMLEHLGFEAAAVALEAAVRRTYAEGVTLTPDQGGSAGTEDFCAAVSANLRKGT